VQCWATDTSSAWYSSSKFTGTLKSNRSTPIGALSIVSGSAADDAYPPSAAREAERQKYSCASSQEPTNTGCRVSTACISHRPSLASITTSPPALGESISSGDDPSVSISTSADVAPTTTVPCCRIAVATPCVVTASERAAVSPCRRVVRVARAR
jgi:hypothetical protein